MRVPLSVLLVEDSPADAELVLIALRAGGYEPEHERMDTPEDMAAALTWRSWDIVLSDYVMPRFSGPAALKLVQDSGLDLPVIMVTGQVGEEMAVETMKAGASDYVLKDKLTRLVPAIKRELRDAAVRRERKQTGDALRKSEERLTIALGAGDLGVWELDLINHSAWRSLRHDQIFGYDTMLPEWTYEMFLDHVVPEHRDEVDGKFQKALETGNGWEFECQIRRADGAVRWIWAQGEIAHDGRGEATRMLGVVRDVTKRKQTEEELIQVRDELERRVQERTEELETTNGELLNEIRERKRVEEERERLLKQLQFDEARWRTLVESIPELVTVCDAGGRATYVNQAQSRLFGYRVEPELAREDHPVYYKIYRPDGTIFAPEDLPLQRAALHGEEERDVEIVLRTPDGEERITEWDAAPIRDAANRTVGAVAVGRDVTGRKRAEEERERLLKEVEERKNLFQMVVRNAPSGIAVLRGHDLVYEIVNPAYQLFAPGKEIVGRTFVDVWPEAASEQAPLLRKVLETGEPFHAADLLIPIRRSSDGPFEERYWTYSYLPLPPDSTGQPGIVSWVTETTETVRGRQRMKDIADEVRRNAL